MKKLTFTLSCALLFLLLGTTSSYATNPISMEAGIELGIDVDATKSSAIAGKKQTIVGKFFKKIKTKFNTMVQQVKAAYYEVARSAKGWLWLWIVLGLVGFLMGILAVGISGGFGTFLSYAAYAAYVASAVCFVLWIVALVG